MAKKKIVPTAPRKRTPRGAEFQFEEPMRYCRYERYLFSASPRRRGLADVMLGHSEARRNGTANRMIATMKKATVGKA